MALIEPGVHPVETGLLAEVLTTLESTGPSSGPVPPSALSLTRWSDPPVSAYKALFRAVGAPWLWFSRLVMDDATVATALSDPLVRVWRVFDEDQVVGFLELDNRQAGLCELQYVGLLPSHVGQGHGRWLLAEALRLAWGSRVEQVRVRTCTLDHPAALPAYLRAGFVAVARHVEVFPDPRLIGLLPRSAGQHVPIIQP